MSAAAPCIIVPASLEADDIERVVDRFCTYFGDMLGWEEGVRPFIVDVTIWDLVEGGEGCMTLELGLVDPGDLE